jgi:hypothetical protein
VYCQSYIHLIRKKASQLFLQDDFAGRPLLVTMTDPDMPYFRALQLFPHKSVYANVRLDYLVPYFTACKSQSAIGIPEMM